MATNFDFNVNPYYDDYDDSSDKHGSFHRILFRPGRPPQARELTQLQTMIQHQIERFGEFIFEQGSQVTGGSTIYDDNVDYIKLEPQFNSVDIDVSDFDDNIFVGKTSLSRFLVFKSTVLTTNDPNTVFVKYRSGTETYVLKFEGDILDTSEVPGGDFTITEVVTGDISGSTGVVVRWDSTNKLLWLTDVSGDFDPEEEVRGGTSDTHGDLAADDHQGNSSLVYPGETIINNIPEMVVSSASGSFKLGEVITGTSSLATGQVVGWDSVNNKIFFVGLTGTFDVSEVVTGEFTGTTANTVSFANLTVDNSAIVGAGENSSITSPTGKGSVYSVDEGVFYVSGFFAKCSPQTIVLEKYSTTPSYRVGFITTETTVDSNDDDSLLDNAQGFNNENAPGADRYKLILTLSKLDLDATSGDEDFIELVSIENGVFQRQARFPQLSEIEKIFARRTFDESGSYTTKDFKLNLEDHDTDETKFIAKMNPGKAYIEGYEFETIVPKKIEIDRARSTNSVVSGDTLMQYGTYFVVDTAAGSANDFYDVTAHEVVEMHCALTADVDTTDSTTYTRTLVGTGRIRHFGQGTSDPADSSTPGTEDYKMYLY